MFDFLIKLLGIINKLVLLPSEIEEKKAFLNLELNEEKESINSDEDEYDNDFIV